METMRYQENKKGGKWPIIAFSLFVVIGGALIYLGIANEDNPQIVGQVREEVQSLVDIYTEETVSSIEETKIDVEDIEFKIEDEKFENTDNKKFKADITIPKIYIDEEELADINKKIKTKYVDLFDSLKSQMTSVENKFTFKTTYKYYDNTVADKRILSITIHQRIIDDVNGETTTDKVETYNIDLETKEIIDEATIAINTFGKEYKTIIKNNVKEYVISKDMLKEEDFKYSLTGLENYYIRDNKFHIIFNEGELVSEKYGVIDIEIKEEKKNDKADNKNTEKEEKIKKDTNKEDITNKEEE